MKKNIKLLQLLLLGLLFSAVSCAGIKKAEKETNREVPKVENPSQKTEAKPSKNEKTAETEKNAKPNVKSEEQKPAAKNGTALEKPQTKPAEKIQPIARSNTAKTPAAAGNTQTAKPTEKPKAAPPKTAEEPKPKTEAVKQAAPKLEKKEPPKATEKPKSSAAENTAKPNQAEKPSSGNTKQPPSAGAGTANGKTGGNAKLEKQSAQPGLGTKITAEKPKTDTAKTPAAAGNNQTAKPKLAEKTALDSAKDAPKAGTTDGSVKTEKPKSKPAEKVQPIAKTDRPQTAEKPKPKTEAVKRTAPKLEKKDSPKPAAGAQAKNPAPVKKAEKTEYKTAEKNVPKRETKPAATERTFEPALPVDAAHTETAKAHTESPKSTPKKPKRTEPQISKEALLKELYSDSAKNNGSRSAQSTPEEHGFFSEFPSTEPDNSKEPVISRTVKLYTGQRLRLDYPGEGWVYLGESTAQKGIKYQQRKLQNGITVFNFNTENKGSYLLNFSRFDAFSDNFIADSVLVEVEDSVQKLNNVVKAPDFKGTLTGADSIAAEPAVPQNSRMTVNPNLENKKAETAASEKTETVKTAEAEAVNTEAEIPKKTVGKSPVISDSPDVLIAMETETKETKPQEPSAEESLESIRKSIASGNASEALNNLNSFFQNYSVRADEAWFLRGQAYELNGKEKNIKLALDAYQTVVKAYPDSARWDEADARIRYIKKFYVNID